MAASRIGTADQMADQDRGGGAGRPVARLPSVGLVVAAGATVRDLAWEWGAVAIAFAVALIVLWWMARR